MTEKPTYEALEQRIAMLENESARRNRFEAINSALFKISNAVNTTSNLDELFQAIHLALSSIIDTTNFYIALYDEANDSLMFPYYVDSADDNKPPVVEISKTESITAKVIRTRRPVMVTKAERLAQLAKTSLAINPYTPSEIWLGVPLKIRNHIFGVMAVQSYHDPKCYDQTDVDVMVSVADQVAIAVERKKADKLLRESEQRYRTFIDSTTDLVFLKDNNFCYLLINRAYGQFLDCSEKRVLGKTDFDLMPLQAAQSCRESDLRAIEYQQVVVSQEQMGDNIFETLKFPVQLPNRQMGVGGFIRNITARKQAEALLKDENSRWCNLFEQSRDGIVVIDQNGKVYEANKRYADMLGYSMEEINQLHIWDWDTHFSKEQIKEMIRSIDDAGAHFETRQRRKDGTIIDVELSNNGTVYKKHKLVFCICRDITERKRLEAEKTQLEIQNRLLQKAESLGRMAGAIAHNFNNQLQVVIGNLEMAMNDKPSDSECMAEALKAARKAADVSGLMLTYLGQKSGKQELIDLSKVCRRRFTLLQAAAPKGMILNADFPCSGPIINADVGQMQQILTNLVTNAWESITGNWGTIGLTVKTVSHEDIPDSKRFPINWQPKEVPYAYLEVTDAGVGIADKDIEKLFDPFFTTKFIGRGMGLSVVLGIVQAHGGGVTVESEPGRGSIFRIFLPVSTEELPIQQDLPAISEAQLTGQAEKLSKIEDVGTVLLIEDEEQVRNMAKMMLNRLGYTVLEAKDGAEALDIFQKHPDEIRFVLSDLTMPRMDGWETLTALRKLSPDIPVILSSGYDEAQVMAGEHPERPNTFLGKPYQLKGLRETISRVLADHE